MGAYRDRYHCMYLSEASVKSIGQELFPVNVLKWKYFTHCKKNVLFFLRLKLCGHLTSIPI